MALFQSHTTAPTLVTTHDAPAALTRVYAWFSAVNANDLDLLEDLNAHGVPPDSLHPVRHTTALMKATRLGRIATVRWLLARGAAPALLSGLPKGTAIHCALRRKHWAIASLLVEHVDSTAVIDAYGFTPLHALCAEPPEKNELYQALILMDSITQKGCALDALDHEGITALHQCIINDATEMVEVLLSLGANPNALIPDTWVSPLMIAALEKNLPLAQLLIHHGADPYLKTREGASPSQVYPAIVRDH